MVLASYGHVRDLVQKPGSVDPDNNFAMLWQSKGRGMQRIKDISTALGTAGQLILATDADREGEAISWHLLDVLQVRLYLLNKDCIASAPAMLATTTTRLAVTTTKCTSQHLSSASACVI